MKTEKEKKLIEEINKGHRPIYENEKEKKIEAHTQVSMKAYDIGVIAGKAEAINREVNMQCLNCGVSLHREIMDKKIHIHLCKECRMKYLEEQTSGEMK